MLLVHSISFREAHILFSHSHHARTEYNLIVMLTITEHSHSAQWTTAQGISSDVQRHGLPVPLGSVAHWPQIHSLPMRLTLPLVSIMILSSCFTVCTLGWGVLSSYTHWMHEYGCRKEQLQWRHPLRQGESNHGYYVLSSYYGWILRKAIYMPYFLSILSHHMRQKLAIMIIIDEKIETWRGLFRCHSKGFRT